MPLVKELKWWYLIESRCLSVKNRTTNTGISLCNTRHVNSGVGEKRRREAVDLLKLIGVLQMLLCWLQITQKSIKQTKHRLEFGVRAFHLV